MEVRAGGRKRGRAGGTEEAQGGREERRKRRGTERNDGDRVNTALQSSVL